MQAEEKREASQAAPSPKPAGRVNVYIVLINISSHEMTLVWKG